MNKGFTLIELLVVVGILAVLAIAALIAINPLEAQRRTRDTARLQDLARLSSTFEAYLNDEGVTGVPATVTSVGAGVERSQDCDNHWINDGTASLDFCAYLKQVPLDPQNDRDISSISDQTTGRVDVTAGYGFAYLNGDYEFCTYLEAEKNRELLNDGGTSPTFFETGSSTALACTPVP